MEKIAIITDSSCDLSKEIIEKYNIFMLSLRVIYKDREYLDRVEIFPQEVYDKLSEEIPTTSLPSLNDMEEMYSKIESEGYTHIIAITLSSGLSGTFNALKLVSQNHTNIITSLYDSKVLSLGLGLIVEECANLLAQGKSFEETVSLLPDFQKRMGMYYVLETLEYLKKGGRIGLVAATLGEMLKIKPIISINDQGKYYTYDKVRGRKQSISKLMDIAMKTLKDIKAKIYILQGDALDEAQAMAEIFKSIPNVVSLSVGDISPALVVHTGPGLLGIIVLKEG